MAKTIKISDVVTIANRRLTADVKLDDKTPEEAFRIGVASLLEQVLHTAGSYRGFGYVDGDGRPVGYVAGITDETRRAYGY